MPDWAHRFIRPREGWLSLFLLFVMLLSAGWSVQAVGWLDEGDFLVPVAIWGMLAGATLALLPLSVTVTLPVGALLGAGVVLWSIGGEYFTDLGQLGRLLALRDEAFEWLRLVVDRGFAPQMTPYAIGLGVIMWSVAFIAAYTLYRHHRVLDAILLVGAAMVVNLSATLADLLGYLVLFCLAALLLWLRAALTTREEGWQLRRVDENVEVPISIMRSGLTFIGGSIALAWILTTVAVAAPLTDAWRNLDTVWTDVRDGLEGVFGGLTNENARIAGSEFGPFTVRGTWFSDDAPVMQLRAEDGYYLRSVTLDVYTGSGWDWSEPSERSVPLGERVFTGYTPERPLAEEGFLRETITIEVQGDVGRSIFVPGYPTLVSAPVVVREVAGAPLLASIDATGAISPGSGYQVTALISEVTEAQLAGAGTEYPREIAEHYLSQQGITPEVRALAAELAAAASADTPFHQADAIADFLRTDESFEYGTDVEPPDPNRDLVDQFLFGPPEVARIGYCEYFASAMALMARSVGIPARVAVGYAPGELVDDGVYQYRNENAHAWAELYFPGYGWQIFEATKTIPAPPRARGQGGVAPPIPADINRDFGEIDEGTGEVAPRPSFEQIPGGAPITEEGLQAPAEPRGGNLLVILALAALAGGVIYIRMRGRGRGLRFLSPADRQWLRLAWAGDRAGLSQRPSETYYEYAGWLEEQIPTRAIEIRTIADGKVWQAYSGRAMSPTMIERIEGAWKRLRMPFVGLAVRRRLRNLRPTRR
ncbi:MAG TPA: transglutaminase domain-containing protein [Candidatus Limnocylindria bacterium]|nr:transglutaminase domain-containing protein [Candidatus Limnocylindria bacterium]